MSNVSIGPKERTASFGEGNRERYEDKKSEENGATIVSMEKVKQERGKIDC